MMSISSSFQGRSRCAVGQSFFQFSNVVSTVLPVLTHYLFLERTVLVLENQWGTNLILALPSQNL